MLLGRHAVGHCQQLSSSITIGLSKFYYLFLYRFSLKLELQNRKPFLTLALLHKMKTCYASFLIVKLQFYYLFIRILVNKHRVIVRGAAIVWNRYSWFIFLILLILFLISFASFYLSEKKLECRMKFLSYRKWKNQIRHTHILSFCPHMDGNITKLYQTMKRMLCTFEKYTIESISE